MFGKKALIFILLLIIIGVSSFVVYKKFLSVNVVSPVTQVQPTAAPPEELATWIDPSEFSFQYPKNLTLNPHDEDQENYAHVELTSATHSGNLILWTKDTNSKDLEDWLKQTKIQGALDSTLGEEPAKKVLTSAGETQKLTTTAIRGGYLYQIEANLVDSDFWKRIYETVSSTYKFGKIVEKNNSSVGNSPANSTQESTGEDYSGDEVIE